MKNIKKFSVSFFVFVLVLLGGLNLLTTPKTVLANPAGTDGICYQSDSETDTWAFIFAPVDELADYYANKKAFDYTGPTGNDYNYHTSSNWQELRSTWCDNNAPVKKVDLCHKTNSQSNPWNIISVDENGWESGHPDDFLYEGSFDPKDEKTEAEAWCAENEPKPEPTTSTISATKIVCDSEEDLPNWGAGGADITSSTASNFLAEKGDKCHQEDWTFEWSLDGVANPGDNEELGGDDWNSFSNTAEIPSGARIWVREQMKEKYIPFTGANTDQDVSAEFYCNTDVLNYDNWDWIDPVVAGETYYCVGFNVPVEEEDPKMCDVVSDETNIVEDGTNAVETWNHSAWYDETLLGSAAKWIWETFNVVNPTTDETKVFVKTFGLDSVPTSAVIEVSADNGFILEVNGTEIANEIATESNYGSLKTYNITNLVIGNNTVRITVKNFAQENGTAESNPAGALYKLHIVDSNCKPVDIIPNVDVCDNINGNQIEVPDGYYKEGASCYPTETPKYQCNDGVDNSDEEDNLVDSADPACHTDGDATNSESYDPTINSEVNGDNVKQCSDGVDNDDDGQVDYPNDSLGCESATDDDETDTQNSNRRRSSSGSYIPQGRVLGAETSCGIYVDKFLRKGLKDNDSEAVGKVQKFLNDYMGSGLVVDNVFGEKTDTALKAFQLKHADKILTPWGLQKPTGIFYLTTQTEVNNIMCPELNLSIPPLIPMEQNPLFPKN